uniref:30S ribosomal protein S1 n=1 Tax=uncultured organism TaxID=155900 RepID=W0NUH5_9ZZZZ|nr:30S ribosomal protein S1 [uncultured organism]
MTPAPTIDLGHVARDLHLPPAHIQRTVELLDEGNTVPFITRYRKDQTGGLDEEQIREIQFRVGKIRQLAERKATILKTIETQGKLTPELAELIQHANTPKRLEDLYLPFKPKKQTLATIARERGLEPLAIEIYEAHESANDMQARAATFIAAEKELHTVEDVLAGVGHLIAERFSENAELRGRLRRIFARSGKIVCTKVEAPPAAAAAPHEGVNERGSEGATEGQREGVTEGQGGNSDSTVAAIAEAVTSAQQTLPAEPSAAPTTENPVQGTEPASPAATIETVEPSRQPIDEAIETSAAPSVDPSLAPSISPPEPPADASASTSAEQNPDGLPTGRLFEPPPAPVAAPLSAVLLKKKKKKKKKVIGEHAFKDYYNYVEPLGKVPPHRVLAINRGERAHAIRVKIEADEAALFREADEFLVWPKNPHAEFLRNCVRDSLTRLIIPSLERELRREMTERAEEHAVEVFIRNLRKLLLQSPTRSRRVLAIDPGFKSGSKMAALDEFGNVLGHGMIFVIGKDEEKRKKARTRLADLVKQHGVAIIAIGNGTGCRETEQLVADTLAEELKDQDVAYVVVNEAGASIYSTSPLGREELPQYDALQRGAISIGRRLLDPLSEMVKIHPANLGVGLYQHDIKAKHLKDSLDAVVESCVNFVGVDVNSASPALLRYVSGMNALTARRVYEHRRDKGPFKSREDLKQVQGFGDQTFVQAAGFLKVIGSENPLDATWIHPESYEIARRVLEKMGCDVADLAKVVPAAAKEEPKKEFAAELVASAEATPEAPAPEVEAAAQPQAGGSDGQTESASDAVAEPIADAPGSAAPAGAADVSAANADSATAPVLDKPAATESQIQNPKPRIEAPRNPIAEKATTVNVPQLAAELSVGTHLLQDILNSFTRPALDPRDSLASPVFRRGIMKLEDLAPAMELSGTVLNVVDFGVFVDIGLSDSGLVHISRLADRFIKDPHEVVGVGDVLKVWVVDIDKSRRRVSLTAIPPGSERPPRPPREQRPPRPPRQRQGGQGGRQQQGGPPPAHGASQGRGAPAVGAIPAQDQRPPRPHGGGGGRRDQRRGDRPQHNHPQTIERPPTKPKKFKPITKAQEEGREPMRSFGDLQQLFEKKKQKPKPPDESPPPETTAS